MKIDKENCRKVSRKTLAPRIQTKNEGKIMCSVQFIPLLVKYINCGGDEGLSFHPGWANNYCCLPLHRAFTNGTLLHIKSA